MKQKAKLPLSETGNCNVGNKVRNYFKSDNSNRENIICPNCNMQSALVWVHGHYQCITCKAVVISCCDGASEIQV